MKRQAGFTLLEVLLVVVLMSLAAMAVMQTIPPSQDNEVKEQASRFFQRLQLLADDAMLNGEDFGLRFDEQKSTYAYMILTQEGWVEIKNHRHFNKTEFHEEALSFQFDLGSQLWGDDERLFSQDAFYDELFEDEENQVKPPQVYVLSSGEITPFEIAFTTDTRVALTERWRVKVDDVGQIRLLMPGESDEIE